MYQEIITTLLNITHQSDVDTKAASVRALGAYYGKDAAYDTRIIDQLVTLACHANPVVEMAVMDTLYGIALRLGKSERKAFYRRTQALRWQGYLRYQRQKAQAERVMKRARAQWRCALC